MVDITTPVAYLAALSMAAERLVQIIRGLPGLALTPKKDPPDPKAEIRRVALINLMSVGTGIATAALASYLGSLPTKNPAEVVVYGVLAGAGSGFWNAVLSYLLQLKNLKKSEARALLSGQEATVEMKIARAAVGTPK